MKYSLKQHILGINSDEYEVVKNHVPEKEDDLTEQKAEFVDTKQKSSGLFSAVIAQLVENAGREKDPQKYPAERDRAQGILNRVFNDTPTGNLSKHRRGQKNRRLRRADGYERPNEEQEEQKAPANRDRDIEFQGNMRRLNKSTVADDNASTPGIKRLKQRYKRFKRKTWGEEEEEQAKAMADKDKQKMAIGWVKDLPPNISKRRGQQSGNRALRRMTGKAAGYDEEEEQRAPSRMNYKFDDKPAAPGARDQQRVRGGRTARTDRVVNNNLMRKKDEFVRVDNAFKEGAVGDIFAAAFGMINEMGTAGYTERTMRTTDDVVRQLEQVLSDSGIDGAISESEKELIELETVHSSNDGGFNATLFDILSRRIQGDYSWEEKDAMVRLKNEISQQANPDSEMDNPSQDYGTRAEAPALDYEERGGSI